MEKYLQQPIKENDIVIYGFSGFHEERNVAAYEWLRVLNRYSRRGHVRVPFAMIAGNGLLVRYPPKGYPMWPFRDSLSLISLAEDLYVRYRTMARKKAKRMVTERILEQMQKLSTERKAIFMVVFLELTPEQREHYSRFLERTKVYFVDCVQSDINEPSMKVPGEGHPNGLMNERWAECIAQGLKRLRTSTGANKMYVQRKE
jgi:hypothetical protein